MDFVAAEPAEEVPEHQTVAFQVADDRLDTVSPVLLSGMGLAAPLPVIWILERNVLSLPR